MDVLKINGDYITLHYITLSLFHTPFTPKVTSGASTKLCTTVRICQCKQMSFQLPFESTRINKFLESKRKIIPSFRSGIREARKAYAPAYAPASENYWRVNLLTYLLTYLLTFYDDDFTVVIFLQFFHYSGIFLLFLPTSWLVFHVCFTTKVVFFLFFTTHVVFHYLLFLYLDSFLLHTWVVFLRPIEVSPLIGTLHKISIHRQLLDSG